MIISCIFALLYICVDYPDYKLSERLLNDNKNQIPTA